MEAVDPVIPIRVAVSRFDKHADEGGARGADRLARVWAQLGGIEVETHPAQWERDGKAAGPIRNRAMLVNGRPDWWWRSQAAEGRPIW